MFTYALQKIYIVYLYQLQLSLSLSLSLSFFFSLSAVYIVSKLNNIKVLSDTFWLFYCNELSVFRIN